MICHHIGFLFVFLLILIQASFSQIICTQSGVTIVEPLDGLITFYGAIPFFGLHYPLDSFYVDCQFESIAEVDPDQYDDIVFYDLSNQNFTTYCYPNYNETVMPANNSSNNQSIDPRMFTFTISMETILPNNATIQLKFIQLSSNITTAYLDPMRSINLGNSSLQMKVILSNWNNTKPNSRVKLVARLKSATSVLNLSAGYFSNGYLRTVEVAGPANNIALELSEMSGFTNKQNITRYLNVDMPVDVLGISPPNGRLKIVFPTVSINDTVTYDSMIVFKRPETSPNYIIVVAVSIGIGLCCLFGGIGILIFFLIRHKPKEMNEATVLKESGSSDSENKDGVQLEE